MEQKFLLKSVICVGGSQLGEIQLPSSSEGRKSQFFPQKRMGKLQLPSSPPVGSEHVISQDVEGETPRPSSLGIRERLSGETPRPSSLGIRKGSIAPLYPERETQRPPAIGISREQAAPAYPERETQWPPAIGIRREQVAPPYPERERPQPSRQEQIAPPQPIRERPQPSALGIRQEQIAPLYPIWDRPQPSTLRTRQEQIAPLQPVREKPQPVAVSRVRRGQSSPQKHTTLLYFISAFLIITIITFAGLHAAGISPASLFAAHTNTSITMNYPQPDVKPLFADTFINDASGWNQQSSPNNYTVTVGNGALMIEVKQNKLLWEPLPGTLSYSDFVLAVNAVLTKGDQNSGYGVYIRGAANRDSDLATYYRFELYGDASYALFKGVVDQNGNTTTTKIVDYTLNSAILKQGQANHLMISAQGSSMSFIVNGQLVKSFTDPSYIGGSIALFASNLAQAQPDEQVQFSQLAVYPVQVAKGE